MIRPLLFALPLILTLTACDQVKQKMGLEDPATLAARQVAEGKAVGAACRHSGRAIEDCYSIYHWLPKAPIFEGWQEMDTYMRTNKIESVEPQLPPPAPPAPTSAKRKKAPPAAAAEAPAAPAVPADEKTEK